MTTSWRTGRLAAAVIAFPLLTACGIASAAASPTRTAGVEGQVTAGPTCPVERVDRSCPPSPVAGATVQLLSAYGKVVAGTQTDAVGKFRLWASPGTFTLLATNVGGYRSQASKTVTLTAGHTEEIDLTLDSGIR